MNPKPEYPRPDRERKTWRNLNGEWDFRLFQKGAEADEAAFARARDAYNEKIVVPFSWVSPLSGVARDVPGVGWYRRTARFEAEGRVYLCVGAADYRASVYVNGALAGSHQGGYTPIELDVTDLWHAGENTIEVRCEDYREKTQTYGKQGYGDIQGIWQTVWLEAHPDAHIRALRFKTRMDGHVTLEADAVSPDARSVSFEAAFDGNTWSKQVELAAGENALSLEFQLDSPRLWSPDEPNLYEGVVRLGGDEVSTYFGVREIGSARFDGRAYPWITLNGKPLYVNGTLDQAFNPRGHFTYPSDEDMRMEAWRLKRIGLNMARIHIKPEEPRKLYWMDKLGVLIMQDMPCFWGEPCDEARAAYESEWPDAFARDYNHPCIFSWVMFNETWGLQTGTERKYLPETQKWVRSVFERAKAADPTRIIEDNSACNYDHVDSDINTWHFYINGYGRVRDELNKVDISTFVGSDFNYIADNRQNGAPLMNSECGMVWGVKGSAGDSDIAWQYHYMLNEFRLHDKLCGFVFTEFHDVVNEFNGYYRIDDGDKDFGYGDYCRGMAIRDLHSADFLAVDAPPCQTLAGGEEAAIPMYLSSFADIRHGKPLSIRYELWRDTPDGRVTDAMGELPARIGGYGLSPAGTLRVKMPCENALEVLSLYLTDEHGTVMRNFVTFDVRAPQAANVREAKLTDAKATGFRRVWTPLAGEKLCLAGAGEAQFEIDLHGLEGADALRLVFEAGSKRLLTKDTAGSTVSSSDGNLMLGYRVDRGGFANSYYMTDEHAFPSSAEVLLDGEKIADIPLANDPADARGALSWHAQPTDDLLDEAGSYGALFALEIPSRLVAPMLKNGRATLIFRVAEGGMALYGRGAGRYAVPLSIEAR